MTRKTVAEAIAERVAELVAASPPMTPEQREIVVRVFANARARRAN